MRKPKQPTILLGAATIALCEVAGGTLAHAGGFGVREQSVYFLGTAFAGSAAGSDLSSMYWNSAATAVSRGCSFSSSLTGIFPKGDETAVSGLFVTGLPPAAAGLSPTSTDVATDALVPSSYAACQVSDRLYVGLGLNSPFGFRTKPDNTGWAGSPIATSSKVFTVDINPTVAYKVTPDLTIGAGLQVEYFKLRLNHGGFNSVLGPLSGARVYEADDWGVGATAGILWQPFPTTSVGIGYRSAVEVDPSGNFTRSAGATSGPAVSTSATASVTLPEEVTLSFRQGITPRLTMLGTVEWVNWSRIGNVAAVSAGCGPTGNCEILNLNYRDGWYFSLGGEYAHSPFLTLRAGVGYEISPIKDSTRDILLPDSNRVFLSVGATYKYSAQLSFDVGYSHLFLDDASFCIANASLNGGTSHCTASTPAAAVLLRGNVDSAVDIVGLGMKYKF
ncbi:MAG TPA: outer membrane protein transport protein [Hyphomicrobiaceae bacterium]|nr:outer membrane protein transport protein [Hyphomicrobiaceae bacterium]